MFKFTFQQDKAAATYLQLEEARIACEEMRKLMDASVLSHLSHWRYALATLALYEVSRRWGPPQITVALFCVAILMVGVSIYNGRRFRRLNELEGRVTAMREIFDSVVHVELDRELIERTLHEVVAQRAKQETGSGDG